MGRHFKGEIGTDVLLDTGIDLSAFGVVQIWWKDPAEVVGSWVGAVFSSYSNLAKTAATSFIKYTLTDGDLDTAGTWRFQAYAVDTGSPGGTWWGEPADELIYDQFQGIK